MSAIDWWIYAVCCSPASEYPANMATDKMAAATVLILSYIAVSMVSACVPPACVYEESEPEEVWGKWRHKRLSRDLSGGHGSTFHSPTEKDSPDAGPSTTRWVSKLLWPNPPSSFIWATVIVWRIIWKTRMWANAQPDGRPAKHRWRPLFNLQSFADAHY